MYNFIGKTNQHKNMVINESSYQQVSFGYGDGPQVMLFDCKDYI